MSHRYKLTLDKPISDLSVDELRAQRDIFLHWTHTQTNTENKAVKMGNAPDDFKQAFETLVRWKEHKPLVLEQQMKEALVALQQGFFFSENAQAATKRGGANNKHGHSGR